jgi:hypothetical protein
LGENRRARVVNAIGTGGCRREHHDGHGQPQADAGHAHPNSGVLRYRCLNIFSAAIIRRSQPVAGHAVIVKKMDAAASTIIRGPFGQPNRRPIDMKRSLLREHPALLVVVPLTGYEVATEPAMLPPAGGQ